MESTMPWIGTRTASGSARPFFTRPTFTSAVKMIGMCVPTNNGRPVGPPMPLFQERVEVGETDRGLWAIDRDLRIAHPVIHNERMN